MKAKKGKSKKKFKEWRQLYKKMNHAERLEMAILMLKTIENRKRHKK